MWKRYLILHLLLFFVLSAFAQEKLSYAQIETKSYALYQNQNWKELIRFSAKARKQGVDYFYLQARTGIALYKLGKYRLANKWFLKAYEADQSFDWLQEYLYYSLFLSARYLEASNYAAQFPNTMKQKLNYSSKGVYRVSYEGGFSFNPDFEKLKARLFADEIDLGSDYGEGYFLKNYSFHSFSLSHKLSPRVVLNHNLTYLDINRETLVDWEEDHSSYPTKVHQYQYYINPVFCLGKKLNVSSALNFILGNSEIYAGWKPSETTKSYSLTKFNFSDFVFATSIWSDFGNFSPGIEIDAASVNASHFFQFSPWFTFYPLSNSKLYFTPRVYLKSGTGNQSVGITAYSFSAGASLGRVYLSGEYLFGSMENFIEANGFIVNNFIGKSDYKLITSLFLPIGKNHILFMRYLNQDIQETYRVYADEEISDTIEYNYIKQTLTIGITWNI
jgi:hypothetical protein